MGKIKWKKRWIVIGLFVFLGIINARLFWSNCRLQKELEETVQEIGVLQEEKANWENEKAFVEKKVTNLSTAADTWKWLEDGYTKKIQRQLSLFEVDKDEIAEREMVSVEVIQDLKGCYQVRIPDNPYSEGKINDWLLEFYQTDQEKRNEFLSIGITKSDVVWTEQEKKEAGYFYDTDFQVMRADGAVISFQNRNTACPGLYTGSYLPSVYISSVNFDTKSGKILKPEDIFWDKEEFCEFASEYIKENFADKIHYRNYIKDEFFGDGWCLTEDGIMLFHNWADAGGEEYLILYEQAADYIKTEYLPAFQ